MRRRGVAQTEVVLSGVGEGHVWVIQVQPCERRCLIRAVGGVGEEFGRFVWLPCFLPPRLFVFVGSWRE